MYEYYKLKSKDFTCPSFQDETSANTWIWKLNTYVTNDQNLMKQLIS